MARKHDTPKRSPKESPMNWELEFGECSWFTEPQDAGKRTDYVSYHKPKTERKTKC